MSLKYNSIVSFTLKFSWIVFADKMQVDLMVVLDSSANTGPKGFQLTKDFLTRVIQTNEIGPQYLNIIILFANSPVTEIKMNLPDSNNKYMELIKNIQYGGKQSKMAELMNYVKNTVVKRTALRGGYFRPVVLLLGSCSPEPPEQRVVMEAVTYLYNNGVRIYYGSVGNKVDLNYMMGVAWKEMTLYLSPDLKEDQLKEKTNYMMARIAEGTY
jgi:uncharacterized protein YegL